jgi:hypothetical protein
VPISKGLRSDDRSVMSRLLILLLLACAAVPAQQQTRRTGTVTYDVNGRPVAGAYSVELRSGSEVRRTAMVQSVNGREVPVESVEERVIHDEGGRKVIERLTRRYDANGRPGPPERLLIEHTTNPGGSATIVETNYRSDINGRTQLWQRSTTEVVREGSAERSETRVERRGLNAALEVIEKKTALKQAVDGGAEEDAITYRRSESGRFYEAAREITERKLSDGLTVENTVRYEAQAPGQLRLTSQTVKRTSEEGGGTRTEVDVFSVDFAGRAVGTPQLNEQQLIERKPAGGGYVESVSVRRTNINDPNKLGRFEKVAESTCTGDCEEKSKN